MTNHSNVIQSKGVCIPKNKIFQKLTFLKKEYYLGQEANKEDIVDGVSDADGEDDRDAAGADIYGNLAEFDYDFSDIEIVYENEDEFEVIPQGKTFS